jgi:hypothetical protein
MEMSNQPFALTVTKAGGSTPARWLVEFTTEAIFTML